VSPCALQRNLCASHRAILATVLSLYADAEPMLALMLM
jgi:hypothetical protein